MPAKTYLGQIEELLLEHKGEPITTTQILDELGNKPLRNTTMKRRRKNVPSRQELTSLLGKNKSLFAKAGRQYMKVGYNSTYNNSWIHRSFADD